MKSVRNLWGTFRLRRSQMSIAAAWLLLKLVGAKRKLSLLRSLGNKPRQTINIMRRWR